jgi:hypothetical protein
MTVSKLTRTAALAAVALAAGIVAAPQAMAQEGVAMRSFLGSIGLVEPERPEIIYRERAPLVVPPKMELRPPEAPGAVATRNPQWPNDPDVVSSRAREADARTPTTERERFRMLDRNPRLSIDEVRRGRRDGGGRTAEPARATSGDTREDFWIPPAQMRAMDERRKLEAGPSGTLTRNELTEPPSAFLAPAGGGVISRDTAVPTANRERDEADPKAYIAQQQRRR